ncbi:MULTISPECIES: protein-L-isoaspartate(D-aspartate) O-methyltransferase [Campylobacter]|uniref:protein-L-isoaspartate(D-aspartate) O-methyltransferase n=1 Tax=Campylobacter TaxID=194 RepID=UPI000A35A2AA|nr:MULTISPECIES: protein-L-isoaspartate(D-aspartate) O-methyltransferase [unclassified Campylobacter]MCR8678707.1 protein-L-isoaspartate(D-aspartate) O-methyltransferase [Campylobacter sp. RM19072]MCR8696331.1 protein-L-isoaspartate(D-aspartate) O-methyltransferase [Campylobacter sp. RM19073]
MDNLESTKCQTMSDEIASLVQLSPMVYKAFINTPRTPFVPVSINAFKLDAHPIGSNQWISSPLTVAKMTMALEAENCDNILEVGCGSGYQAAILAKVARRVFSVERIEALANSAKSLMKNLGINNVFIRFDDGNLGWRSYAPYDRIILSCFCKSVPDRLFSQLKDDGILVAPVEKDGKQYITQYKKSNNQISSKIIDECVFVPLLDGTEQR